MYGLGDALKELERGDRIFIYILLSLLCLLIALSPMLALRAFEAQVERDSQITTAVVQSKGADGITVSYTDGYGMAKTAVIKTKDEYTVEDIVEIAVYHGRVGLA